MTIRVVFFGSSESVFSNRHFEALAAAPCAVVAVVDVPPDRRTSTNTGRHGGADFVCQARERGLAVFEPPSPNRADFAASIRGLEPDLFVAVGYTNLLKDGLLALPRLLAANFHASLLPAYRGKHPLFWALRNGERWAGLTVHEMDRGLDTGRIIYQVRVRTRQDDSVASLYERVIERSLPLMGRLVAGAAAGGLPFRPQGEPGASYYSAVGEADFRLDWSCDAARLCRWIRTSPGQCFCTTRGQRLFFLDAEPVLLAAPAEPGQLIEVGRSSCIIATGQGALRLRRARCGQAAGEPLARLCRRLGLGPGDGLASGAEEGIA